MNSLSGGQGMQQSIGGRNVEQFQQFTPEQMQLFQSLFSHAGPGSFTSRLAGGDQALFDQMESGAKRQFGEQQGQIASRFSQGGGGPGAMSARRGSGFQNTMNQASSDFASRLQGNRMELQRNAIRDLMSMSNDLLQQKPYENYAVEEEQPWWQKLIGGALPIAAGAAGTFFSGGNPLAGAGAYQAGSAASKQLFG